MVWCMINNVSKELAAAIFRFTKRSPPLPDYTALRHQILRSAILPRLVTVDDSLYQYYVVHRPLSNVHLHTGLFGTLVVTVCGCDSGGLEPGTSSISSYYKRGWYGGHVNGPLLKRHFVRTRQSPILE